MSEEDLVETRSKRMFDEAADAVRRRSRQRGNIASLPGFSDLDETWTDEDLFIRCMELRWHYYGDHISRSPRCFNGRTMKAYVESMGRAGVSEEAIRIGYRLSPEQWKKLMRPDFFGNLTIKPAKVRDEGPLEKDDHDE